MLDRSCPPERQEELLALLLSHTETPKNRLIQALAFRLNRDPLWERRLQRLETLRHLTSGPDATPGQLLLYARCVLNRLNAELDPSARFLCAETLRELTFSPLALPELLAVSAHGILNRLRVHPNLNVRRADALFLRKLAEKEDALSETRRFAAIGLVILVKAETDFHRKLEWLSWLAELWNREKADPELTQTYAEALAYAIQTAPALPPKRALLAELRCLPDVSKFPSEVRDSVRHALTDSLILLVREEKRLARKRCWLHELQTMLLCSMESPSLAAAFAHGISVLLESETEERTQLRWLTVLQKLAEKFPDSEEMLVFRTVGMLHRLRVTQSADEADGILRQITNWGLNSRNPELHCLLGCALLLTMRWEPNPSQRILRARIPGLWRNVNRSMFAELFRSSLNDFIGSEWDEKVRKEVLSMIRERARSF